MKINLNDRCRVILTKEGAETLNAVNEVYKSMNIPLSFSHQKEYKEGDTYEALLHELINTFNIRMGTPSPFYLCEIEDLEMIIGDKYLCEIEK